MNAKDALLSALNMSRTVLTKYVSDLSDEDLMRRPHPGCNHLAWQLGHLISSESSLVNMVYPGHGAELPPGFAEAHSRDAKDNDNPASFLTKQEYLELFAKVQEATAAAIQSFPEDKLDDPAPERMRSLFPTVGDFFMLAATHPLMHAGQFVPIRRELGKPVVI